MHRRGDLSVTEREDGLDKRRCAGRGIEVADVALERADRNAGAAPVHLGDGPDLGRVADVMGAQRAVEALA